MNYGLPYLGSKNLIAKKIIDILPSGERLVDLFAGGCAITHCAMLSGKYKRHLMLDLSAYPQIFINALHGQYNTDHPRWVSREEFNRLKDKDPVVALIWSFGNTCGHYLYGKKIESVKHALHEAIVNDDFYDLRFYWADLADVAEKAMSGIAHWTQRRFAYRKAAFRFLTEESQRRGRALPELDNVEHLERAERLNSITLPALDQVPHLERIERIASLGQADLPSMEFMQGSYTDYVHQPGDIVYADPPYITANSNGSSYGTNTYTRTAFAKWIRQQDYPIYISEYSMPSDFVPIARFVKIMALKSDGGTTQTKEQLWLHERWAR